MFVVTIDESIQVYEIPAVHLDAFIDWAENSVVINLGESIHVTCIGVENCLAVIVIIVSVMSVFLKTVEAIERPYPVVLMSTLDLSVLLRMLIDIFLSTSYHGL